MQKSFVRKSISVLLSLLMVLSVFGGMTFTASAEDQMETISFRNENEVRTISGTHFTITPHADGGIYADGYWDFDGDYPDDYAELSAVYGETITKLVFHIDTGYDNYPIVKADGNSVAGSQSGDLWTFDNVNASSVNIFANPNYEEEGKEWWNFKVFELDVYFDASNAPAPSDIVAELISAIGTVTLTNDCKEKIDAARSAYDNLAEADQALVGNYAMLTDAEAAYQALVDQAAADRAIAAINKIGEFEVSPAYKVRFDQANNTYNGLTDAQKALVTNYDVLEAARAAAEALPYVSAGNFGGLYWAIDTDGVLTFVGSGETNMYAFRYNSSIRKVIINSSVTKLKSYSFGSCPNLTEVEFQNANPKIDNFVFAGCGNLSKVTLAEGLTKIGYNMFNGCGSLRVLTLPRSVNYIDEEAFAGSGIRTLRIPYGLGHTTNALAGMGQLTTLVIDSDSAIAFTSSQFPDLGSATNVYVPVGSTFKTEDTKKWDLVVKDEYLNDYDADDFAAARALFNSSVYDYYNEVSYALQEVEEYGYERDKYEAREVTVPGMNVTLTDGAQVASLFGAATIRTYTTAPSSVEALIAAIGTVNASDECKAKIDAARAAYDALSDELKAVVNNYDVLTAAEEAYAAPIAIAVPQNLQAAIADGKVTLTWDAASGAQKYMVYVGKTENGPFNAYAITSNTTYTFKNLSASSRYYKVRGFVNKSNKNIYGGYSDMATCAPCSVNGLSVEMKNGRAVLTWAEATGAEKYMVYYSATKDGPYTAYGFTSNTTYTLSRANVSSLWFKVRAFKVVDGAKVYGPYSKAADCVPGHVNGVAVTATGAKATLTWNETTGAEKYMVYTSDSADGPFKAYGYTSSLTYTVKKANAEDLFYQVRAFVTKEGAKVYGAPSAAVQPE